MPKRPQPQPKDSGTDDDRPGVIARLLGTAGYGATLPERFIRSLAAGLGGAVRETAELALPDVVKRTTVYSILLDRALRFIVEDVGQVEGRYQEAEDESGFMVRKVVGNFVELAGLLTLHASPLWILALVGDSAYGVRTYLDLLVDELKAKGVLEASETIASTSALLRRLERLSSKGALAMDLPPMALKDLQAMVGEVRREAAGGVRDVGAFTRQANGLLDPLREVAAREGVSLFEVSAVVGMRAVQSATRSGPVARAMLSAGTRLLSDEVLAHYADGLRTVREQGFYPTLRETYGPYVSTIAAHFNPHRRTLTDDLLSGRLFQRLRAHQRPGRS